MRSSTTNVLGDSQSNVADEVKGREQSRCLENDRDGRGLYSDYDGVLRPFSSGKRAEGILKTHNTGLYRALGEQQRRRFLVNGEFSFEDAKATARDAVLNTSGSAGFEPFARFIELVGTKFWGNGDGAGLIMLWSGLWCFDGLLEDRLSLYMFTQKNENLGFRTDQGSTAQQRRVVIDALSRCELAFVICLGPAFKGFTRAIRHILKTDAAHSTSMALVIAKFHVALHLGGRGIYARRQTDLASLDDKGSAAALYLAELCRDVADMAGERSMVNLWPSYPHVLELNRIAKWSGDSQLPVGRTGVGLHDKMGGSHASTDISSKKIGKLQAPIVSTAVEVPGDSSALIITKVPSVKKGYCLAHMAKLLGVVTEPCAFAAACKFTHVALGKLDPELAYATFGKAPLKFPGVSGALQKAFPSFKAAPI